MADIDSLQIAIGASASSAETAIDNLCKTLDKLGSSLNGVNVTKVSAEFAKLKQAVDSIAGITAIGDAVGKLKEINKISVGKRVTDSLAKLGDSVKNLPDMSRLNEMADALQRISGISGNFGSQIAGQVNQIANAGNAASASRAFGGKGIFGKMLKAATGFIGGIKVADLVTKSNQYIEDVNLFTASMGKGAAAAKEYADRVSEVMGIDPADWMRNQGVFQTLITGFGVGAERATIMSQNLTQLGYDLSSFFNIAVTGEGSAMQKIQAAISGELEPIRRLGYDLSYTTLNAYAASMGLGKTIDKMNQAEKAQLRYYALMKQVTVAQGDMSRTLESPANQLRILKAQFEQAARAIGNVFIPIINAMLPPIIAGIKLIRGLAETVASFMGFKLPEIDYTGLDGAAEDTEHINSNLTSAAKQAKDMLAKFDELNVITKDTGSGSGSGSTASGIGSDWAWELPQYDFLGQATMDRVEKFYTAFKAWWDDWYPSVMAVLGAIAGVLIINNLAHTIADVKRMTEVVKGLSTVATIAISAIFTIAGIAIESNGLSEIMVEDNVGWDSIGATLGGFAATMLGATFLGKGVAAAAGQAGVMSLKFGIGFAFLATSIEMAIQDVRRANTHGMDIGTIGGALGAGLTGALGLKLASAGAAKLFPAFASTGAYALMSNLVFDIGVGFVIAGITTAVSTLVTASHSGINDSVVIGAVTSGIETGLGVALISSAATTLGTFASAVFGIGMGLAVTGVTLTIAEIKDIEMHGLNASNIWGLIASSAAEVLGATVAITTLSGIALATGVALGLALAVAVGVVTFAIAKNANIKYKASEAFKASGAGSMSIGEVKNAIAKHFSEQFSGYTAIISLASISVENKEKMESLATELQTLNALIIGNDAPTAEQITKVADAWKSFDTAFSTFKTSNEDTLFAGLNNAIKTQLGKLKEDAEQAQVYLRMISGQMSEADAKAISKRDDILSRWGSATDDEQQWYYDYVRLKTGDANGRLASEVEWANALSGKNGLNYDNVEVLQNYMKEVVQTYATYADQTEKASKAYYDSYMTSVAMATANYELGMYDEDPVKNKQIYDNMLKGLQMTKDTLIAAAAADKTDAQNDLQTVFLNVFAQALSGMNGKDYDTVVRYMGDFIDPLYETMAQQFAAAGLDTTDLDAFYAPLPKIATNGQMFSNDKFQVQNLLSSLVNVAESDELPGMLTIIGTVSTALAGLTQGENPVIEGVDNTEFVSSMNEIIKACNLAGQAMAGLSNGTGGSFNWTDVPLIVPAQAKADGGFVDEGELFIAREAGAEMVGAIGRKTAVANNDQIVAGITNGVSQANGEVVDVLSSILAVLRAQGSGSGDGTIQPSAGFGRLVKRSLELYGEVTG